MVQVQGTYYRAASPLIRADDLYCSQYILCLEDLHSLVAHRYHRTTIRIEGRKDISVCSKSHVTAF